MAIGTFTQCGGGNNPFVGTPNCDRPLGKVKKVVFTPLGEVITYTSYADVLAQIQAKCLSGDYLPIDISEESADNTEAVTYTKTASGVSKGNDGIPDLTLKCQATDYRLLTQFRAINGSRLGVFIIDIFNTKNGIVGNISDDGMVASIDTQLVNFEQLKTETGTTANHMPLRVIFAYAGALTEYLKIVDVPSTLPIAERIKGNKEVLLFSKIGTTVNAFITAICSVDGEVIASTNSNALLAAANWDCKTAAGVSATPTLAVSTSIFTVDGVSQTLDCIEFTFATAGTYTIKLKDAATLAAATVPLGSLSKGGYQNDTAISVTVV